MELGKGDTETTATEEAAPLRPRHAAMSEGSWHSQRLVAFDLETTGVNLDESRIVTASISIVGGGEANESYDWLINPGIEIPAEATEVHGISNAEAQEHGRPPAEAIPEIVAILNQGVSAKSPLVAFNARFDFSILDREVRRNRLESGLDASAAIIDPYVIDRQAERYRPGKRTLVDLCRHYGVDFDAADAHAADVDALQAARLAYRIGQCYPNLGKLSAEEMHQRQIGWAETQARGLKKYFEKKGNNSHVDIDWPIVPAKNA